MPDHKEEKQPWDRQKSEQSYTYSLFNEYLKLGPLRTISKLSAKLQDDPEFPDPPKLEALQKQATRWKWKFRAEAYDDDRILRERKELEARAHERLIKRLDQNEEEEDKLHDALMDALDKDKIIGYDKDGGPIYPTLGQRAYAVDCFSKAKKNASDSQRLDYGEPTTISSDTVNVKKQVDEDLLKDPDYIAAKRKAMDDYHAHKGEQ
jgi:hypothetical protein